MLFSASKGYLPTAYNIPSKVTSVSHMWSMYNMTRSRNCERLILKHKLLKTTPPSPYFFPFSVKGSQLRRSKRLYSKAPNQELAHDSPSSLNPTTYNFIKNRRKHQPCLCSDPSIPTKNLAAVCRPYGHKAVDVDFRPSFMWFTTSVYIYILSNDKGFFSSFDRDTPTNI